MVTGESPLNAAYEQVTTNGAAGISSILKYIFFRHFGQSAEQGWSQTDDTLRGQVVCFTGLFTHFLLAETGMWMHRIHPSGSYMHGKFFQLELLIYCCWRYTVDWIFYDCTANATKAPAIVVGGLPAAVDGSTSPLFWISLNLWMCLATSPHCLSKSSPTSHDCQRRTPKELITPWKMLMGYNKLLQL